MRAAWQHIQAGGDPRRFFRDLTIRLHRAITDLRQMAKPIIAAIHGAAGGADMSLAAACDLRVAADSAKFRQASRQSACPEDRRCQRVAPYDPGLPALGGARLDRIAPAHLGRGTALLAAGWRQAAVGGGA